MKLSALIAEIRENFPEADDAKTANLVIEAALDSADPVNLLFPAVHAFVITTARSRVRAAEQKAASFRVPEPKPSRKSKTASLTDAAAREKEYVKPGSDEDPAIIARRALLRDTVYVPGKGRVAWGELEIADHQARIDFLSDRIAGHQATIDRHQEAVDVLKNSGAKTLNEFYSPASKSKAA